MRIRLRSTVPGTVQETARHLRSGSDYKRCVVNRHRLDADPDLDPGSTFQSNADPYPDSDPTDRGWPPSRY